MPFFKKKPVVIEARKLDCGNIAEIYTWVHGVDVDLNCNAAFDAWEKYCDGIKLNGLDIPTLEDGSDKRAKHVASIGDYIIKGVKGEFYPIKADIFLATYDFHDN